MLTTGKKIAAGLHNPPSSDFDGLSYPLVRLYPQLHFIKMIKKDVKEIT